MFKWDVRKIGLYSGNLPAEGILGQSKRCLPSETMPAKERRAAPCPGHNQASPYSLPLPHTIPQFQPPNSGYFQWSENQVNRDG